MEASVEQPGEAALKLYLKHEEWLGDFEAKMMCSV